MKSHRVVMAVVVLILPAVPTYATEQPTSAGENGPCWCGPLRGATYMPASLAMVMRDKYKYEGRHLRIRGYLHLKPGNTYICPSPAMRWTPDCLTLIASKTMYRNRAIYHGTRRSIRRPYQAPARHARLLRGGLTGLTRARIADRTSAAA